VSIKNAVQEITMKALLNDWINRLPAWLRGLGPYAAIELLLPGGSVIALFIWLCRRHANVGVPPASTRTAAVIGESIGIPPHLSLPLFDAKTLMYLTTINQYVASSGETHVPSMHRKHSSNRRRSRIHGRNSGGVHGQVQPAFQSESSQSASEIIGEIIWQPAKRETSNTGTGMRR
jgi:hypothetical protein